MFLMGSLGGSRGLLFRSGKDLGNKLELWGGCWTWVGNKCLQDCLQNSILRALGFCLSFTSVPLPIYTITACWGGVMFCPECGLAVTLNESLSASSGHSWTVRNVLGFLPLESDRCGVAGFLWSWGQQFIDRLVSASVLHLLE